MTEGAHKGYVLGWAAESGGDWIFATLMPNKNSVSDPNEAVCFARPQDATAYANKFCVGHIMPTVIEVTLTP